MQRTRVLVVVGVLALCGCSLLRPGPAATVIRFIESVEEGQYEEAIGFVAAETLATYGRDKVRAVMVSARDQMERRGGIQSLETEAESITGDSATVRTAIVYGNGVRDTDMSRLRREDGRWKIVLSK